MEQHFITGAANPCGIAIDSRYLYWADHNGDSIGRANLNGSGANEGFINGGTEPCGVAIG